MSTGVYIIENIKTGHFYIGSATSSFESRWGYHIRDLKVNKHHSSRLQNSWNKYGPDCFKFKVLSKCAPELCIRKEQFYMDTLEPEFNMNPTAGNCLGRKFSEESKKKMSESAKKRGTPPSFLLNHLKTGKSPRKQRKSRAVPGARKAYADRLSIPIIAYTENVRIEFTSMTEAERQFRKDTSFNTCSLRAKLNKKELYFGYFWESKCLE